MKKQKILIRMLVILLLLAMTMSMLVACKEEEAPETTTTETEEDNGPKVRPHFAKENNNQQPVTFLYTPSEMYNNFYFDDITEAGDIIEFALQERRFLVEDYLGIEFFGKTESSYSTSIYAVLSRDNLAGVDTYQTAMTHGYIDISTLTNQGLIMDQYELQDISFNEDFWNVEAIESLEIGGKAYYTSSDFNISDVQVVFFNKDMYEQYLIQENPYELVKSGQWTLEKFMELCSKVDVDNGDLQLEKDGIYGLGVRADWEFIPLITSCEVECLQGSGYRTLNMGPNNERYLKLYELVEQMADADWSYMYNYGDDDNKVTIADGRFLFTMEPVKYSYRYLAYEVRFGILPYPKFDTEQKEYHSLDAGGLVCVPVMVKNKALVGKTLESLAVFSGDTIKVAYYERLIGTRIAEAPEDSEMLDKYIFGRIALEPVYNFCEKANMPLGILLYTIPKMLRAKLNGTAIDTIATNWASYRGAAQLVVDNTINR